MRVMCNCCWFSLTATDENVLGPEGMEKFCEDIGVEPENVSYNIHDSVWCWTRKCKLQNSWLPLYPVAHFAFCYSPICPNGHLPLTAICLLRPVSDPLQHIPYISNLSISFSCLKRPLMFGPQGDRFDRFDCTLSSVSIQPWWPKFDHVKWRNKSTGKYF
jgi:hypothetical protein